MIERVNRTDSPRSLAIFPIEVRVCAESGNRLYSITLGAPVSVLIGSKPAKRNAIEKAKVNATRTKNACQ